MLLTLSSEHSELVLDFRELYEVPSGSQVDGLPPAPLEFGLELELSSSAKFEVPRRALRQRAKRNSGAGWS